MACFAAPWAGICVTPFGAGVLTVGSWAGFCVASFGAGVLAVGSWAGFCVASFGAGVLAVFYVEIIAVEGRRKRS